MYGFERAMQEYERRMECPYDVGGALYEEEDDEDNRPDEYDIWRDRQGEEQW